MESHLKEKDWTQKNMNQFEEIVNNINLNNLVVVGLMMVITFPQRPKFLY